MTGVADRKENAMNKIVTLVATLFATLMLGAPLALAHTPVTSTSIADNAVLEVAPETFDLTLEKEVALTSVKLSVKDGREIPLDF